MATDKSTEIRNKDKHGSTLKEQRNCQEKLQMVMNTFFLKVQ